MHKYLHPTSLPLLPDFPGPSETGQGKFTQVGRVMGRCGERPSPVPIEKEGLLAESVEKIQNTHQS